MVVGQKGLGDGQGMSWSVEDMCAQLRAWGQAGGAGGELIVKSDGEPALLAVKGAVMNHHRGKVIPEQPAQGEKAENGLIEEAGKTVREYACTFISQIEEGIGKVLETDLPIFLWVIRWVAICYSRYAVGRDGRTGYERLMGRVCEAIVVPMEEKVWCLRLRAGERQNKAEIAWFDGIWLGLATGSSETLVGTDTGVVRASSIKRPDQSQRCGKKMIKEMQGRPQQPDPSKPGLHMPV